MANREVFLIVCLNRANKMLSTKENSLLRQKKCSLFVCIKIMPIFVPNVRFVYAELTKKHKRNFYFKRFRREACFCDFQHETRK